jgi:hypothetical protein
MTDERRKTIKEIILLEMKSRILSKQFRDIEEITEALSIFKPEVANLIIESFQDLELRREFKLTQLGL